MDVNPITEHISEYQMRKFCLELREQMIELKTFVKIAARRPSERLEHELLNSNQVMTLLKIQRGTLQKLRDNKILPFSRLNDKIYYKISDVEALLKANNLK